MVRVICVERLLFRVRPGLLGLVRRWHGSHDFVPPCIVHALFHTLIYFAHARAYTLLFPCTFHLNAFETETVTLILT